MKITVLVGSLRRGSLNRMLAKNLARLAQTNDSDVEFEFADLNLPLFNQDLEEDFPAAAAKLKTQIEQADGILAATPEYNRSLSGVMKNAIDWSSRPKGQNSWRGKPVAVVGATPGLMGTAVAQEKLREILEFLNAKVMTTSELYMSEADKIFSVDGQIINSDDEQYLSEYALNFLQFVKENKE